MEKKYTISEIKKYLLKQDSMGDILYNLSEENIDKAQEGIKIFDSRNDKLVLTIDDGFVDDDIIKMSILEHMQENGLELSEEGLSLDELLEDLKYYIEGYEDLEYYTV